MNEPERGGALMITIHSRPDVASRCRRGRSCDVTRERSRFAVCCALFMVVTLGACTQAEDPVPAEFLGLWYHVGSGGGVDGIYRPEGAGHIRISADHTIEAFDESGASLGARTFALERGPSIFISENEWILRSGLETEVIIRVHDGGERMTMQENAYDGTSDDYARSR